MANAKYTVKKVRYARTHRGVNAYAELWCGDKLVANIEDRAEDIVCQLYLKPGADYAAFVKAARKAMPRLKGMLDNDNYIAGEYARELITQAENSHAK